MKKTFKFMAMALAAVVMAVGTVSCDQNDKTPEITSTPDGALWSFDFMYGGQFEASAVLDLGVKSEGTATIYFNIPGHTMGYSPNLEGAYTVNPNDNTSGAINITDPSGSTMVISYSELSEETVLLSWDAPVLALSNVTATKADESILAPAVSSSPLDGKQWVCPDPTTEGNMAFFFDFGTSIENTLVEGNIYLIPGDYYYTSPFATNNGEYVITSTNATSGTFSYLSYGTEYEYEYFDLTETSVKIKGIKFGEGDEHEYYEFTVAEQTITWDSIM